MFVCNICGRTLKKKYNLEEHLKTHSRRSLFKCTVCSKKFTRINNLRQHFNSIHPGKKVNWKLENSVHQPESGYECFMCKKLFTKRHNLHTHMQLHSNDSRKYKCDFCGLNCSRNFNLKRHILKYHFELQQKQQFDASLQNEIVCQDVAETDDPMNGSNSNSTTLQQGQQLNPSLQSESVCEDKADTDDPMNGANSNASVTQQGDSFFESIGLDRIKELQFQRLSNDERALINVYRYNKMKNGPLKYVKKP